MHGADAHPPIGAAAPACLAELHVGRPSCRPVDDEALFLPDGDAYVGTELIQGGWHPDQANGGAVLALLGHALDDVPSLVPMTVSRFTADLVRPVVVGRPVRACWELLRQGKKIQVVLLRLLDGDTELVRATVLRLRHDDLRDTAVPPSTTDDRPADTLVPPAELSPAPTDGPGFLRGIDLRRSPHRDGSGHGAWLRLVAPVVAGEPVRAGSRLAVGFDFANLVGVDVRPTELTMINPDVSAHVLRVPEGDWVAVTGDSRFEPGIGRGVSSALLSDHRGVFASVSISQILQRR